MRSSLFPSTAVVCAGVALLLVAGCGDMASSTKTVAATAALTGNWRIASASAPASMSQIAAVTGSLQVVSGAVSGTVHTQALATQNASALCLAPANSVAVSGTTASDGTLTLTSQPFANGSVLTVTGVFDPATKTLSSANYQVKGGSCAVAAQPAVAVQYQPISGTYNGNFVSDQAGSLAVAAVLTQTSTADANGNFQLSGRGTFAQNPCVVSPVVTSSTVTGNNVQWTYTDSTTGAVVTASGTFNNDATVLTINSYALTGGPNNCADTGHGVLTKQ